MWVVSWITPETRIAHHRSMLKYRGVYTGRKKPHASIITHPFSWRRSGKPKKQRVVICALKQRKKKSEVPYISNQQQRVKIPRARVGRAIKKLPF